MNFWFVAYVSKYDLLFLILFGRYNSYWFVNIYCSNWNLLLSISYLHWHSIPHHSLYFVFCNISYFVVNIISYESFFKDFVVVLRLFLICNSFVILPKLGNFVEFENSLVKYKMLWFAGLWVTTNRIFMHFSLPSLRVCP